MSDFQVRDIVETNEYATELLRDETCNNGRPPEGKSAYFKAGERGRITSIDQHKDERIVYVTFDDGEQGSLWDDMLDLVYRPINDPALYDRSLLDLLEAQS